jgi:hypothetical protein
VNSLFVETSEAEIPSTIASELQDKEGFQESEPEYYAVKL